MHISLYFPLLIQEQQSPVCQMPEPSKVYPDKPSTIDDLPPEE
jgi:hypothetical protein